MKTPHLILRKTQQPRFNFRSGTRTTEAIPGDTSRLSFEVNELTSRERAIIESEPTTVAVAPSVPLTLINPVNRPASGELPPPSSPPTGESVTWGIRAIKADTSPFTGNGVTVAVLDTGIDLNHPAFAGVDIKARDFTEDNNPHDMNGHGTHCAGTIFGKDVNGYRIGIARGIRKALIGKVLDNDGNGDTNDLVEAILWAVQEGASVLSMSLGINFPGLIERWKNFGFPPELAASQALVAYRENIRLFDKLSHFITQFSPHGITPILIAASGNESRRNRNRHFVISAGPPAAAEGFVSVGAVQETPAGFEIADFSNTSPVVVAPGVGVISARTGGGFSTLDGTSMAAPHAAGVAVLLAEKNPSVRIRAMVRPLREILTNSTDMSRMVNGSEENDFGRGLVIAPQS